MRDLWLFLIYSIIIQEGLLGKYIIVSIKCFNIIQMCTLMRWLLDEKRYLLKILLFIFICLKIDDLTTFFSCWKFSIETIQGFSVYFGFFDILFYNINIFGPFVWFLFTVCLMCHLMMNFSYKHLLKKRIFLRSFAHARIVMKIEYTFWQYEKLLLFNHKFT